MNIQDNYQIYLFTHKIRSRLVFPAHYNTVSKTSATEASIWPPLHNPDVLCLGHAHFWPPFCKANAVNIFGAAWENGHVSKHHGVTVSNFQ